VVKYLQVAHEVSERRACKAMGFPRPSHRYQSVRDDRAELRIRPPKGNSPSARGKILGRVHLAMGDNASFGGNVSVPYHQDFIVFGPTLVLQSEGGDRKLVDRGELITS
jgi:hypothetical protein